MTESTGSMSSGIYPQVVYDPGRDDLAAILAARPFEVLLSAVQVTPSKIVLRFGPPPISSSPMQDKLEAEANQARQSG